MSKNITVRPVQAGDVEAVQSLFEQEAAHNGFSFDEDNPYHPANAAVAVVNASVNEDDINCGWLAFSDGRPVGIITTPQGLAGGVFVSKEFEATVLPSLLFVIGNATLKMI